ncbi:uncharacterized protein LOC106179326 [Lingula anatina]|uniref:Uncharacterized protein LOC106179326 n=1 Tax=Lingula anatina TaxID=7574 RepID=A0A1S3K6V6_LINAN|nr:uncharacterized protein LOC106179326 [Lingula anatina]|eukprot:XP_013418375.1 uncharacterized protein LOC106179326 [Lingula anatina]
MIFKLYRVFYLCILFTALTCGDKVNSATVTCPVLDAPAGGHIKLPPSRNLLSEAEFGCDPGLTLSGSDKRQCQGDSTWNGVQPVCSIPSSLCPNRLLVSTFHNCCYEFQLNFTKWEAAKIMCEEQNGTLVDASVEGVVQYLGWQAEKIGFEYFHTLQKTVILLKSYNGQWTNSSVLRNIWILPFICQYGPYYVNEQTTHPVYISTSTGTGTGSTVTAHGQVQVSDYLPKYLLWVIIGTCGGVVLVMLMVICALQSNLRDLKSKLKNSTDVGDEDKDRDSNLSTDSDVVLHINDIYNSDDFEDNSVRP